MLTDMGDYEVVSSVRTEECSLRLLNMGTGQYVNPHHHHKTTQTVFVIDGEVEVTVEGTSKILHQYDILRIKPGKIHSLQASGPARALSISIPPLEMDDQHLLG